MKTVNKKRIQKKYNDLVSIVIPTYNRKDELRECLDSLLKQTYKNFEIIVSDDASTDNTEQEVKKFDDKRIIYIRNQVNKGASYARNKAIINAHGNYIFFTDSDVIVPMKWIEKGLTEIKKNNYIGVEGKIYYVSKNYKKVYSDRIVENLHGGRYMTANMLYVKKYLYKVGLFDLNLRKYQDRDLAKRIMRYGKIYFSDKMIVYHKREKYNLKTYFFEAEKSKYLIYLVKKGIDIEGLRGKIYAPERIIAILFPFLVLLKLFRHRYRTKMDYLLFLMIYPRLIYERFIIWKTCIKLRVFII